MKRHEKAEQRVTTQVTTMGNWCSISQGGVVGGSGRCVEHTGQSFLTRVGGEGAATLIHQLLSILG